MNPYYKDYAQYLNERFPGEKIQKISINAGFSCPNRDGSIGSGGCIYCDNKSFTPSYCFESGSVSAQIEKGKKFFSKKYPRMKYLAYFQSFSNTFGDPGFLEDIYYEALNEKDVVGLIIGTRPDCIDNGILTLLKSINKEYPVFVELGAESSWNTTLRLINRGHVWEKTVESVSSLHEAGLDVGLHLIMGLPGENEKMMLQTVKRVCSLPIDSLKFHHLQVLKGTKLHTMIEEKKIEIKPFDLNDYIDLCVKIINLVPPKIAIERFLASSPSESVISPKWGLKNYEFVNMLHNRLSH